MATPVGNRTLYTLDGVEKELDALKNAFDDDPTSICKNYVPIRLVTIIEQFFRIMKKQGKFGSIDVHHVGPKKMPKPISLSILTDIFVHHGNRIEIKSDAYKESIQNFCDDKNNNCKFDAVTYNIEFSEDADIKKMVEDVLLGEYSQNIFEWIAVHTHSFQTARVIKRHAGDLLDDDDALEKYTRLFDARHSMVHTLSSRTLDNQWFDLVKDLFKAIKAKNP